MTGDSRRRPRCGRPAASSRAVQPRRRLAASPARGTRGSRSSSQSCTGFRHRELAFGQQAASRHAQQLVLRRAAISTAVRRAQPAGEVGQRDRPARRGVAAGEQHRAALLGGGVQQVQQRVAPPRRYPRRPRRARRRPAAPPAPTAPRPAAGRRRPAPPTGAAGASCRGPPRPTAPGGGRGQSAPSQASASALQASGRNAAGSNTERWKKGSASWLGMARQSSSGRAWSSRAGSGAGGGGSEYSGLAR